MSTKRNITSATNPMSTRFRRRIGQALLTFLAALALGLIVSARAGTQPAAIPFSDIGARATANYQGDALGITATADGARLRCGFQKLEGHATPEGLWLESTKPGGGQMRLVAVTVGREETLTSAAQGACAEGTSDNSPAFQRWEPCGHAPSREATAELAPRLDRPFGTSFVMRPNPASKRWAIVKSPSGTELARTGTVSVHDKLVRFTRPGLTEEYSVSVDGVRQDFIIESPPLNPQRSTLNQSARDLRIELALSGARAEAAAGGARLSLDGSGRTLAYSRLRVEDATGRELPARLDVLSADRLAVSVADANATYPLRIDPTFSDADWVSLGSGIGGYGSSTMVYALAVMGTDLYVGGFFYTAGGVWAVNNIAKWNGSAWSALGSGMTGVMNNTTPSVFALAVSGTNLYVGGNFTMAGGVSATNIAKWDGSTWSALGSGVTPGVRVLAASGTSIYAGGGITTAGGLPAINIAKWDGSAWSALGSGISGGPNPGVYALAVSGASLYAAGWFTSAGGVAAKCIAKWDGSVWSALGSGIDGVNNAVVEALAVSGTDLYAGGGFTTAGGVPANWIAKWDGSSWSALGSGVNGTVSALAVNGTDLYAGGQFTTAGGLPAWYIAKWNGWTWSALGSGIGGADYPNAYVLAADGAGHLFVGGSFTRAGTNTVSYIAEANVGPSVGVAPIIESAPTNQNTLIAGTADFSVVAGGTPPLGYQWYFGTDGILGATNSALQLTNVQPWQKGVYTVLVTNAYGGTTSAPAVLAVLRLGIVVTNSEAALRAAITGGGTVTFACDGTITLASTLTNNVDLTLDGTGHQVTINGGGAVRAFCVNTNVHFTVVNLTIANGTSRGGSAILNLGGSVNLTGVTFSGNTATIFVSNDDLAPQGSGGAIFNRGGTVAASNCSFVGNTAWTPIPADFGGEQVYGGAIRNEAGQVNLRSCAFVGNRASGGEGIVGPGFSLTGGPAYGGAIHNSGTVTLDLCTFAANSATGGDGYGYGSGPFNALPGYLGGEGSGGAIFNQGTLTVDRTTLCGNTATGGSGGWGGADGNTPPNGYAGGNGGGASGAAICNLGSLLLTSSTLASNVVSGGTGGAGRGGGQFMTEYGGNGGSGGNGSSGLGGGLFNSGAASLVNCTIAFNTGSGGAGGGGGAGAWGIHWGGSGGAGGNGGSGFGGVDGTCNLVNCTVGWNRGNAGLGGAGGAAGSGPGVPGANGTSGSAWGGTACGPLVNTLIVSNTPAGGESFSDPKLGPLADNGGPTLTMALLPGSPAIDAGNTSLAPATDQRGFPRPAGLAADIGAFESGSVMPTITISRSGATGLNILASGNAGKSCRLLRSTDLSSWVPLATAQIGSDGTILFYDTCAPGGACRFYRLVMP